VIILLHLGIAFLLITKLEQGGRTMKTRTLIFITILVLVVLVLCVGGENQKISILNIFDDYIVNPDLKNSEGFGCVIKTPETDILFDTGYYPTGAILLSNMEK